MNEDLFDDVTPGGLTVSAAAAGASTAVELLAASHPALAAAGAAVVGLGLQTAGNIAGSALTGRLRRVEATLARAADSAGLGLAELEAAILADPGRTELAMAALDAAARTQLQAKIHALGQAIATGALATDEAVVDAEHFVVRALAQIEAPHVRLLQILSARPSARIGSDWSIEDLADAYPQGAHLVEAISAGLVAIGAMGPGEATAGGSYGYRIKPFGSRLLKSLTSAAE